MGGSHAATAGSTALTRAHAAAQRHVCVQSGLGVRTQRSSQYNSTSWPTNVSVTRPLLSSQPTTLASLDDVRSASHADASADALEDVLDDMHESGETFAHFFMVHSHFFRRRGGQGLVQVRRAARDRALLQGFAHRAPRDRGSNNCAAHVHLLLADLDGTCVR